MPLRKNKTSGHWPLNRFHIIPLASQLFLLSFRTIVMREVNSAGLSMAGWARAAGVERRSLQRFGASGRGISISYAWRICEAVGFPFPTVAEAAESLALHTKDGRPKWTPYLWRARSVQAADAMHDLSMEVQDFSQRFCLALAGHLANTGLSKAELARRSGVARSIISRLEDPARQNLMLDVAYRLAESLGQSLSVLAELATVNGQSRGGR